MADKAVNKGTKVLVISHNVFSKTTAMGKSMADMLGCVPAEDMAQLYFHAEVPTTAVCKRYLRIRDGDVLRSVLTRRCKTTVFTEADIESERKTPRIDTGVASKAYQFGRRRTPMIYLLRNFVWTLGRWESRELDRWLDDFAPDIIFFASGDYTFAYKIAYRIAKKRNIPILLWCCDDYYISRRFPRSPAGGLYRRRLMKWTKKVAARTEAVIVISDRMSRDYAKLFDCPIRVLRISAKENSLARPMAERSGIFYVGGLGVNRIDPLVALGRQLKEANIPGFERIQVYSNDKNPNTLALLTDENGICFHGGVSAEEVPGILGGAKYLLHVEAFDRSSIERTRYSLSTKIGESLASGACLIAYGPRDISSMAYLEENHAAILLDDPTQIVSALTETDDAAYERYVQNALELVRRNHDKQKNDQAIRELLHIKN